jgi:hypothetical protein
MEHRLKILLQESTSTQELLAQKEIELQELQRQNQGENM